MHIKIFISPKCPKCKAAKKLAADLKSHDHNVTIYDISTVDGLTEAAYCQVQDTPAIIVEHDDDISPELEMQEELEIDSLIEDAGLVNKIK